MKKRIIAAVLAIIVMFCFAGCGQGTGSSNGTQTQTSSKGIDGEWELKVDDEDTEILTIEGENAVLETWDGEAVMCEIDSKNASISSNDGYMQYNYELIQDKLVLSKTKKDGEEVTLVFHRKQESGE